MNGFINFRIDDIEERQIDTFLGICKGIIADGEVNKAEADFLHGWLLQNITMIKNPLLSDLMARLSNLLKSDVLENSEAVEIYEVLKKFAGDFTDIGEISKPTSLPLNHPKPDVIFDGRLFLCTGTFSYGNRKECNSLIMSQGGLISKRVVQALDYLVVGDYVTESWKHESFGRKIENAVYFQQKSFPIKIITEKHMLSFVDKF